MMKRTASFVLVCVVGLVFASSVYSAEEKKKRELPQSGTIAGSTTGGYGSTEVSGVWGGDSGLSDGEGSPVSGSISRIRDPGNMFR